MRVIIITAWGKEGIVSGQFRNPGSIATDTLGNVYVLDTGNNRIQKFDSDGNAITMWNFNGTR